MGIITGHTLTTKKYVARFSKNTSTNSRTFKATLKAGDKTRVFTINQAAAEVKSFKWSNGQTAITRIVNEEFTTNYNVYDLTVTCNVEGCTGRLDSSGIFKASLTSNDGVERNIVYTVSYNGTPVGVITIVQDAKPEEKYFYLDKATSATTASKTINPTDTTASFSYATNYDLNNLTTASTESWVQSATFSGTDPGTLSVTFKDTKSSGDARLTIKNGITTLATITISVAVVELKFVWTKNNNSNLEVTATTLTVQETYETNYNKLTVSYTNNVSSAVLSSIQGDGQITITLNENSTTGVVESSVTILSNGIPIGWLTIKQDAAEEKHFWVNEINTKDYVIPEFEANVSCAETPYEVTIITNYNSDSVNFEYGGFLDSVVLSNDLTKVSFTFAVNEGIDRTAKITFYTGSSLTTASTIGSISMSQKGVGVKFFYWIEGTNNATTIQIIETASTATADEAKYISSYPELSLSSEYYGSVVTGFTPSAITQTEGDTPATLHIEFTENVSTTTNQSDTIYVKDGNTVVGMINLLQYPKGSTNDWFRWVINGDNIYELPGYVSKDGYDIEFEFETNIEGLSFYCEHMDWFDEGEMPHTKEDAGRYYCKAKLTANEDEEVRNVVILAMKGQEAFGKLTLKQEATPAEKYIWIVQREQSAATYDAPYTATSTGFTILTNYTTAELDALRVDKTPQEGTVGTDWITNLVLSKTNGLKFSVTKNEDKNNGRGCIISIYSVENVELIRVTVNQEANNDKDFKWTTGEVTANTATTVTSESGDTEGIDVSVTYETDYDNLNVNVDEQYSWIKQCTVDTAHNAVTYHLDMYSDPSYSQLHGEVKLYSNTKLIGRIIVRQNPAPEPGRYFMLKYNDIVMEEGILVIDNVPATLTEETRQFVVSAETNIPISQFTVVADNSDGSSEWITGVTKTNIDTENFLINFKVKNNTGEGRIGYLNVIRTTPDVTSVYRQIRVIQKEMTYEFSWSQSEVVTGKTIGPLDTGATSNSVQFYSTYPSIYVENPSQNGMTCNINGSNANYTVTARGTTEYSEKLVTFNIKSGDKLIGTLTIRQKGQAAPLTFKWSNSSSTKTVTIPWNQRYVPESGDDTFTYSPEGVYYCNLVADSNNPTGFSQNFYWSLNTLFISF